MAAGGASRRHKPPAAPWLLHADVSWHQEIPKWRAGERRHKRILAHSISLVVS